MVCLSYFHDKQFFHFYTVITFRLSHHRRSDKGLIATLGLLKPFIFIYATLKISDQPMENYSLQHASIVTAVSQASSLKSFTVHPTRFENYQACSLSVFRKMEKGSHRMALKVIFKYSECKGKG